MKKYTWITLLIALVLMLGSITTVQAEIIPPYGPGQIGYSAAILCDTLTLRQGPSASAKTKRTLKYGDHIIVMEESDGWAHVTLGDSEDSPMGWVNADYIIVDPAWYQTDAKTPVYAWDDTSAPRVALLDANTTLPILKDEGKWLIVSLRGATGWIRKTAND